MNHRVKFSLTLLVACLVPMLALRAQQQPPPPTTVDPPTAKDVAKAVGKEEAKKAAVDPIARIQEEGTTRSQVMATLSYLTDVIGPRLTGSPGMRRANEWTRDKLASWGLENAHLEPWGKFGRGWSLKRFSAQVVAPQCIPLIAYPKAWSPGTDGTLVAEVVLFDARTEADFKRFRGKLRGAVVLTGPPRALNAWFEPLATRIIDHDLLALADAAEPTRRRAAPPTTEVQDAPKSTGAIAGANGSGNGSGEGAGTQPRTGSQQGRSGPPSRDGARQGLEFARKRFRFLVDEGAAVLIDPSTQGDGGTLFVASATLPLDPGQAAPRPGARRVSAWDVDAPRTVPQVVLATEHYNRMVRMIEQGTTLTVAIDLAVQFHDDDLTASNTIAEIPGTDLKDEVVMLGGHMDSWHSGTGATDNAAGVSVAMEAVRILKALDLKPRRTIRVALWTGEEQGLLGSRAYVSQHFGLNPPPLQLGGGSPSTAREGAEAEKSDSESRAPTPEHARFSAYFNLDNGTGKVRGVYLQGNESVRPLFRKWLAPFRDMDAATLSLANTGGTDHLSFDGVGLPGFQFIQDAIEYSTRTHHSNQDVYDRIQAADMKQAAVIMAAFVYNAAKIDEKLPRKPSGRRVE
jgi:carboxypeptidase Q